MHPSPLPATRSASTAYHREMTNFIFSRRDLQRSINRLANVLEPVDLRKIVAALNRQDRERLPKMWEMVVLDALSQVAPLRHEVELPSGRKPDFELSVVRSSGELLLIVGDIATVSDAGLDEQNPIDVLFREGPRIARRVGLEPNHLGYTVDGDRSGRHGDARIKLQLPPKGKLLEVLNGPVKEWMKSVKAQGVKTASYEYDEEGFKFIIKYDPAIPLWQLYELRHRRLQREKSSLQGAQVKTRSAGRRARGQPSPDRGV